MAVATTTRQGDVALHGVERCFGALEALAGVDLAARPGEVLAVVGPSGCGKSTLLEVVAGLQDADGGTAAVDGRAGAGDRRDACAYMPQRDLLLPWRDALGNAALGLECTGVSGREARERARPLFARFGLDGFECARPAELSGGMRQRVAFVRTLLPGNPVLLLDEPFAALDAITRAEMRDWLSAALAAEPRTVLLVTHDTEEAVLLADRVAVMSPRPGRVVAEIDVELPRAERSVSDPDVQALRARALEALR